MTPDEVKKGIDALKMCRSLITFNPMTGEEIDPIFLNEDNRDLYYGIGNVLEYIQQLEAERKVLINALRHGIVCKVCKHYGKKMNEEPCGWCGSTHSSFEWRGVQEGLSCE